MLDDEIDPSLMGMATLIFAARAAALEEIRQHISCDQNAAEALLDHWRDAFMRSVYLPVCTGLH